MTARSNKSTFKGTSACSCSFTEHCYVQMELYRGLLAEAHGDCMSDKSGVGSQKADRFVFVWEMIFVDIYLW